MEQIYYTQCPVGYGLGASNGFQVKRLSSGYPVTADFRVLGLRAFLPGTRSLAPTVLRYRRAEDGRAEVARLVPRSHEFETERGLWGRPGGHFAHGLRLDEDAMRAIHQWPAGLLDAAFWKRADPERSLGRTPEDVALSADVLPREAGFATASALARGLDEALLARLLSAVGEVTRDGRTLVVIDRPERLNDLVRLLTLAFPEAWRSALTFSTYHDRPEELPGLRLQGTLPDPRANRSALRAMGYLADLTAGTFEPAVVPARWAAALAGWLVRGDDCARSAWEQTDRRASSARVDELGSLWPDAWLDRLYDLPGLDAGADLADAGWDEARALAEWAAEVGLSASVMSARGPAWWSRNVSGEEAGRAAFLEHLKAAESWTESESPTGWARAFARWMEAAPEGRQRALLGAAFAAVPEGHRPTFVEVLVRSAGPELARRVMEWLKTRKGVDPRVLFRLEARGVVQRMVAGAKATELSELFRRGLTAQISLEEVCGVIDAEGREQPSAIRRAISRAVGQTVARADEKTGRAYVRWTCSRGEAFATWLEPFLRALGAEVDPMHRWHSAYSWIDAGARGEFARVALNLAREPSFPQALFTWGVESVLLRLPEAERPDIAEWAGAYLDRIGSGLVLMERLFMREYRDLGVRRWLDKARASGALSAGQVEWLEGTERFARALKSGDAAAILAVDLPAVPPEERGALLTEVFSRLKVPSDEAVRLVLDACARAWPGGFLPDAPGLSGIAGTLAPRLASDQSHPDLWLGRLRGVVRGLGLGFEPHGLAAEVVAATAERISDASPWVLREALLKDEEAWRILEGDVRGTLRARTVPEALAIFEEWDRSLSKGMHTARFFEIWLNTCDGATLAAIVSARVRDLRTLPNLDWWQAGKHPDARSDVREAFARLAPLAPLPSDALTSLQDWMRRGPKAEERDAVIEDDAELVPLDEASGSAVRAPVARPARGASPLSAFAHARWRCLEALTVLHRPGLDAESCRQTVMTWTTDLALDSLSTNEQYLFLAWTIPRLAGLEAVGIGRLAYWLVRQGMVEPERVTGWAEMIGPAASVSDAIRLARVPLVTELRAEWRTVANEARERPR